MKLWMPALPQVFEHSGSVPTTEVTQSQAGKGIGQRLRSTKANVLAALILILAGLAIWWLLSSAPDAKSDTNEPIAPLVEVIALEHGRAPITVTGFGTVVAARDVAISPQVAGVVVAVSPKVEVGGRVRQGETLFRIDPRDFELSVTQAESLVARAEVELAQQTAEAEIAQQDFEELFPEMENDEIAPLALREPQRRRADIELAAARSQLAEARLGLARTVVRAPFDASIIEETIEVGGRLAPEMAPLRLIGDQEYRVIASVPLSALADLSRSAGRSVDIVVNPGTSSEIRRVGRFIRQLASVDTDGRLARILVAVKDPLGLRTGAPHLVLGSYAQVTVDAGVLSNVVSIPPEALRENEQVWVRDAEGRLQYRPATVRWRGPDHILVEITHDQDDELITNYLNDPLPGQRVRKREVNSDG